jgi:hypothetical protein
VKRFYNARNAIPYIQNIEIINAFYDRVSDIKTIEEIAMKKHRIVANLLAITNICIEASKARAQLLESCGKGPLKKKQDDHEVSTIDQGDRGDHIYRGNHQQQSSDQKEKRLFHRPADAEKWYEIHHTTRHDLERVQNFSGSQEDATTNSTGGPETPVR